MSNNNTTPVSLDALAVGRSNTNPFITVFSQRNPNTNDVNFDIQQRWYNQAAETEYILTAFSVVAGIKTAIWQPINASQVAAAETLTGNSGGPVAVDGSNNINVIGDTTTINIVGNPGTHTLTASTGGTVATLYTEDSGTAVPLAGNLIISGAGGITTSGAGHTVTVTAGGTIPTTFTEGTGTATPSANNLNILGSAGITTSGSGSTVTVTAGATIPTTFNEDSGSAVPAANALSIIGGTNISTSGAGHTVTINNSITFTTGTFTPVLRFGGATTGITYTDQEGQYTQIGNLVYFSYNIILSSKGSATGVATITGLPIVAGATLGTYQGWGSYSGGTLPVGSTQMTFVVVQSTSTILLFSTATVSQQLTNANFTNTTSFGNSGFYFTS